MRKAITFYVYCLVVLAAFEFVMLLMTQAPASLVRFLLSSVLAYFVVSAYRRGVYSPLRYAAAYFGLIALVNALILFAIGGLLFALIAAVAAFGCYALGFSAEARKLRSGLAKRNDNPSASNEFDSSEDYGEYKGFPIRRSKNYYWVGDFRFSSMKEVEAFVEDRLAS